MCRSRDQLHRTRAIQVAIGRLLLGGCLALAAAPALSVVASQGGARAGARGRGTSDDDGDAAAAPSAARAHSFVSGVAGSHVELEWSSPTLVDAPSAARPKGPGVPDDCVGLDLSHFYCGGRFSSDGGRGPGCHMSSPL